MKIPFFDYSQIYKIYSDDFNAIFKRISNKGSFIKQKDLELFE